MKQLAKLLVFITLFLWTNQAFSATATLLPNGEQQFIDANGVPLAGGSVYFYIPSTTTPKNTWIDAAEAVANTNPVILDAGGRAVIYGSGQYRQVLFDSLGNQIWDKLTQDVYSLITPGQSVWGGTATGTANALILSSTPSITSLVQGQTYAFIASAANTGSTTANISGIGPKNILTTTSMGLTTLVASNLVTNGRYFMVYDGTEFVLVNPTTALAGSAFSNLASASTTDLGTAPTNNITITGTTDINSFGSSANLSNPLFVVQFSGSLNVVAGANILTPSGQTIFTGSGDYALMEYKGTGIWQVLSYFPSSGFIGVITVERINAAGTYVYTAPVNLLYAMVEVVGAGGGSGGVGNTFGSAGGGSGGYVKVLETSAQIGPTQNLIVGAGGAQGGSGPSNGGAGGATSFGALITSNGGNGTAAGTADGYQPGGSGGTVSVATGSVMNIINGAQGGFGGDFNFGSSAQSVGGYGASNPLGFGGAQTFATSSGTASSVGGSGTGNGAGASGSSSNGGGNIVGAAGQDGEIIVTEYLLR